MYVAIYIPQHLGEEKKLSYLLKINTVNVQTVHIDTL